MPKQNECSQTGLSEFANAFIAAYQRGDIDRFEEDMHDRAVVLSTSDPTPIVGKAEIGDYYRARQNRQTVALEYRNQNVFVCGTTGVIWQTFERKLSAPGETAKVVKGRSMFVFVHDGRCWKFLAAHNSPLP